MTLEDYLLGLRGKQIGVIGLGVSNAPLVELMLEAGLSVNIRDRRELDKAGENVERLEKMGARLILGRDYLEGLSETVIFRTPGLHPNTAQLRAAAEAGSTITSEMEVFFYLCPSRIIAVTGSDGKTTTTSIIAEILRASGLRVHIGGNIGVPLLSHLKSIEKEDWTVLELSSFQLHSMLCEPDIAVVTNISPNHLDVHPDMGDYIDAKKRIFVNQRENDILVLNYNDPLSAGFAGEACGGVRYFRRGGKLENGVYENEGTIYTAENGIHRQLMSVRDILLPGLHNIDNFLAAFSAVLGIAERSACEGTAKSFPGVTHRLERVRTLGGITFYNDSIASSPTRTIAGLSCFEKKVILIAGGYDKNIPFDELALEINRRVFRLYLTGDTAEAIRRAVVNAKNFDGSLEITIEDDFERVVRLAAASARDGDCVLLSPACASFDKFKDFEQRGEFFKEIVNNLRKEQII